ncbi:MAG: hypothetical protein HGA54_07650 [Actinobacteria bacterium]|nr:hypothetical protein [Actinomycetota bacterium]
MALKKSVKGVWGISEVGFSLMATMETVFFMIFLTDVALLPLAITGIIAGSTAIVDAISAVIAGIVIDKVKFKSGKYRPWLLICPPIVTVFFVLCFTKIGGDVTAGILIGIGYVVSHFVWNICWTANRNLIPVISQDQNDRSWLSARIAMGANIGKIGSSYIVPAITTALFAVFASGATTGTVPVAAYTVAALIVALIFLICYYIHYAITKGHDLAESLAKPVSFKDMGRAIATNDQLIVVLLHDALRLVAFYGVASLSAYYAKCVLGVPGDVKILLVCFYLGCVIGAGFTVRLSKKIGLKKTTLVGVIGWLVFQGLVLVLPVNLIAVGAALFCGQTFFGLAYGLTSNLYAMCGTYGEWKTGGQARGVTMAFCSLAIKLGVAVRGVIIPATLGAIGYAATAADPTVYAGGIRTVYALMPIIFIVISLIPLIWFKLTNEKVAQMDKEIAERAAAAVETA